MKGDGRPVSWIELVRSHPLSIRFRKSANKDAPVFVFSATEQQRRIFDEQRIAIARYPFQVIDALIKCGPVLPEIIGKLQGCAKLIEHCLNSCALFPSDETHNHTTIIESKAQSPVRKIFNAKHA